MLGFDPDYLKISGFNFVQISHVGRMVQLVPRYLFGWRTRGFVVELEEVP